MRQGVRRDGAYLYPAFPYDHFTLVSDDDDEALYAYLMTRQPIRAPAPAEQAAVSAQRSACDVRLESFVSASGPLPSLAPRMMRRGIAAPTSPRVSAIAAPVIRRAMSLGAEKPDEKFAGGVVDGWTAYALNASSPAPVPWNADSAAVIICATASTRTTA